ncbi:MAG: hypothetical protein WCG66_03645 [bacterium]|jgi:hypothetical protein
MRTIEEIKKDLQAATARRDSFRATINEGQGGYVHETEIERLSAELITAERAQSPLVRDLAGERAWFNAQGFTGSDLARANAACIARGYSLSDLQSACKKAA